MYKLATALHSPIHNRIPQNMVVMLTVAFNQFVNPWAIEAIGWWYYIVYCGWLVIELVFVITFIVETKG